MRSDRRGVAPAVGACSASASSGRPPSRRASACSTRAVAAWPCVVEPELARSVPTARRAVCTASRIARGIEVGSRQHVQQLDEGALLGAPGLLLRRRPARAARPRAPRCPRRVRRRLRSPGSRGRAGAVRRASGAGEPLRGLGDRGSCLLDLAVAGEIARAKALQLGQRRPLAVLAQQRFGLAPGALARERRRRGR